MRFTRLFACSLMPVALLSSACTGGGSNSGFSSMGAPSPNIPSQIGVDPDRIDAKRRAERKAALAKLTPQEMQQLRSERNREADALWARAERAAGDEQAADLYGSVYDGYPESPKAAEARYREAVSLWKIREDIEAFARFESYMSIAPINPHLKQIERMVFVAGSRMLDNSGGLFQSDEPGLEMLRFVAQNFPAGSYADDSLYRLGRYYHANSEWDIAVLSYKELLISHPESEWRYMTRLALGDTYLERDQGQNYHAGYVDRDPRQKLPDEKAAPFAGPVRSGLELALEQFEVFLDRMEQDPTRRAEYAAHVRYAQARDRQIRGALAAKERRTSQFYARQGDARAASLYARAAQSWEDGSRRLGSRSAGATVRTRPRTQQPRNQPSVPDPTPYAGPPYVGPTGPVPPPTMPGSAWPTLPVPQAPPPPPPPPPPMDPNQVPPRP